MKLNQIIAESTQSGRKNFVQESVNKILGEDVSVGQTVAVVDDPIHGFSGAKGKVRSISDANPGFAKITLENGSEIDMQTSLLVPV